MKKLLIVFLCLILSGCITLTEQDKKDFDKEIERFKKQQQMPYVPEPRPNK